MEKKEQKEKEKKKEKGEKVKAEQEKKKAKDTKNAKKDLNVWGLGLSFSMPLVRVVFLVIFQFLILLIDMACSYHTLILFTSLRWSTKSEKL